MSATVEEVLALADVEKCLEETGAESTYRHCHNACVWLMREIKRAGLMDYNIAWCIGTFWGKEHSWLTVEDVDQNEFYVVDMTVDQFVDRAVPFSGVMTDEYHVQDSALMCDHDKLCELLEVMAE